MKNFLIPSEGIFPYFDLFPKWMNSKNSIQIEIPFSRIRKPRNG